MTPLEIYEATQEHWRERIKPRPPYSKVPGGPWLTTQIPSMVREEMGICIHIGDPSFKFPYES